MVSRIWRSVSRIWRSVLVSRILRSVLNFVRDMSVCDAWFEGYGDLFQGYVCL